MPFDSDIICCVLCQRNGATRCPFCGLGFHAACERKLLTIGQSTGLMDTLASADAGLVESIQKNKVPMPVSLPAENDWWSLLTGSGANAAASSSSAAGATQQEPQTSDHHLGVSVSSLYVMPAMSQIDVTGHHIQPC